MESLLIPRNLSFVSRRENYWDMLSPNMESRLILNEYKLLPFQKEAQALITKQMEEFLFGENATLPPGEWVTNTHF